MSRFEDLRKLERARAKRQEEHWSPLYKAVTETHGALVDYLQLPKRHFEINGKTEPYVKLGTNSENGFEEKRSFELDGIDGQVPFDLGVTIDPSEGASPVKRVLVRCAARYDNGDLAVEIEPGTEDSAVVVISGPGSYETVASIIYRTIEKILNGQYA
ncbi:MAG: hypothetical protein V7756_09620 [Halopseudomonas sp.]|uniref:hypothetical protein n=1 Tax=Halopseudomonas sp. TaxID=2901191 RepID=UPI003002AB30